MAKKPGTRTILVLRSQPADDLDPEPPAPEEHQVSGCLLWPQASEEEERGWVGLDSWSIAAPYGSDVKRTDMIRVLDDPRIDPDIVWQISGSPLPYENKRGRGKPMIVNINKVS
jgi:hypothetical protein